MNLTLHIENVQTLVIGKGRAPRPHRRAAPPHMAASLPLDIALTCKGRGLPWPGREEAAEGVAPPMRRLRAALHGPCHTCGDTGQITCNPSGEVGAFEVATCPVCRKRRAE